jgi:hypothetical protein
LSRAIDHTRCLATTSHSSDSATSANAARTSAQRHMIAVLPPEIVTRSPRTR